MSAVIPVRDRHKRAAWVALGLLACRTPTIEPPPATEKAALLELPAVMLWAWERPESFAGLDSHATGVAVLAATIELAGSRVRVLRRRQPLHTAPEMRLLPVVRVEVDRWDPPRLDAAQRSSLVGAIETLLDEKGGGRRVQLDFEATRSQRPFYRALLEELRSRRGRGMAISITALSSWCFDDRWLSDLPVDEVVPMMYRLGRERDQLLDRLASDGQFPVAACRRAIGLSTSEPAPRRIPAGRRYYFHDRSWDEAAWTAIGAPSR